MEYIFSYHTDIGTKKTTNQDALLMKRAETEYGPVVFAVICDGMGGLSKGEVASSTLIKRMERWFEEEFPSLLENMDADILKTMWESMIQEENKKLLEYGRRLQLRLGTTLTAFLIVGSNYYVTHVGDCRLYECSDGLYQLTTDQTVVAREIALGRMTEAEAKLDARRNVLLQCIGASEEVVPDFMVGTVKQGAVYILCTDGFRHEITSEEIWNCFHPGHYEKDKQKKYQIELTEANKQRGETDNISVLTITTVS